MKSKKNNEPIEVFDLLLHLCVVMNYIPKQKQMASQGRKAMFSLKSKYNQMCLNAKTMFPCFSS